MTEAEVKGVCQFLIDLKKKGHFRTFWDGLKNGVDLLSSEEVPVSSCWEVIQILAGCKNGQDIRHGTMMEGALEYIDAHPDDFDAETKALLADRLARKQAA